MRQEMNQAIDVNQLKNLQDIYTNNKIKHRSIISDIRGTVIFK